MKSLLSLFILLVLIYAFNAAGIRDITDEDLRQSLMTHPELYSYSDFKFTNKVQTTFEEYKEMRFSYSYTRTALQHIAIIDGEEVAVDNAFVNECSDHPLLYECRFITEMGTIEHPHSDQGLVVIEKWGMFSKSNIQKKALEPETAKTLSHFTDLF